MSANSNNHSSSKHQRKRSYQAYHRPNRTHGQLPMQMPPRVPVPAHAPSLTMTPDLSSLIHMPTHGNADRDPDTPLPNRHRDRKPQQQQQPRLSLSIHRTNSDIHTGRYSLCNPTIAHKKPISVSPRVPRSKSVQFAKRAMHEIIADEVAHSERHNTHARRPSSHAAPAQSPLPFAMIGSNSARSDVDVDVDNESNEDELTVVPHFELDDVLMAIAEHDVRSAFEDDDNDDNDDNSNNQAASNSNNGDDDGDIHDHGRSVSVVLNEDEVHKQFVLDENAAYDVFWSNNKQVPYIGLSAMLCTFILFIGLYFTPLYLVLVGGITPSLIAAFCTAPILYFLRKYDYALQCKTKLVDAYYEEIHALRARVHTIQSTNDELLSKNKELHYQVMQKEEQIERDYEQICALNAEIARKKRQSELFEKRLTLHSSHKTMPFFHQKPTTSKIVKRCSLLHGFRRGQMEAQLECADIDDLVHMLPIVIACITFLPFGMTQSRKRLQRILEKRIAENHYLRMQFYFFLVSFLGCADVKRLFRKHKMMTLVEETSALFDYQWDEYGRSVYMANHVYSRKNSVFSDATSLGGNFLAQLQSPDTKNTHEKDFFSDLYDHPHSLHIQHYRHKPSRNMSSSGSSGMISAVSLQSVLRANSDEDSCVAGATTAAGTHARAAAADESTAEQTVVYTEHDPVKLFRTTAAGTHARAAAADESTAEQTVVYTEHDPVKLFRLPLDKRALPGFRVIVPKKHQKHFFDPITGDECVQQLQVKKIFNSNAKPYLIDCFVHDTQRNTMMLSSSFILKQSDDLRKDAAVLKMFEFMNEIWKENGLKYHDCGVAALTYKCIPFGPDIGVIEQIPNCIELNKVLTLRTRLCKPDNKHLYHQLLASAAGAFIAGFVMGIRDRHDDNILLQSEASVLKLFHIDFGYMFGDRVGLDASKMAITSDLKKIFDLYPNGWSQFVELCIKAWLILRANANELIDYARVVFAFLYEVNQIEMFLTTTLKLDVQNETLAKKYIGDKVKNAPKHLKTKMKNLVHGFAQKITSK
eukprot:CAMPEP_0202728216 /NCGR_PEP_ID=MMETSP1385-20130828/185514_1 /ASSEMBLY_ACC=CAM_ASM_000861 /TAXON_ID=933848 /ORGANISM="Elphidium margaritaceum" /LENGTH=1036 /DNA_ID=CAMNT_0049394463 /DNA_START=135 /DNA_END=3245 /DNA_ORIENTATION=+